MDGRGRGAEARDECPINATGIFILLPDEPKSSIGQSRDSVNFRMGARFLGYLLQSRRKTARLLLYQARAANKNYFAENLAPPSPQHSPYPSVVHIDTVC